MIRLILPVAAFAALSGPAFASSDEAWAEFRADVQAKCLALQSATGSRGDTVIEVNRFGSDRFGAALLTTTLPEAGGVERVVCIYDKQAKTAELTAPFDEPPAAVAASGSQPVPSEKPAVVMDPTPPEARSPDDAGAVRPPKAP